MRREMLVGMLVILSLMGAGQARLPQVNDQVGITVGSGFSSQFYVGNVTEITDNFLSIEMNLSAILLSNGDKRKVTTYSPPKQICIGLGSITKIVWE